VRADPARAGAARTDAVRGAVRALRAAAFRPGAVRTGAARTGAAVRPARRCRDRSSSFTVEPSSAGDLTVRTPAASKAAYLSLAVPLPPATKIGRAHV